MSSNELVCNILKYIDLNISNKISINDLSKKFNYDRYYIMRIFKREIGLSINVYINKIKVYNSLYELNNTSNSLLKVAFNNGFFSLEYYSEIFKREIGLSPNNYRIMIKKRMITDDVRNKVVDLNQLIIKKEKYIKLLRKSKEKYLHLSIFK